MSPEQLLRVLFNEVIAHRVAVVWAFIFIALSMLGAGLVFPKKYAATALILIDETNIIQPLTEGVAAPTDSRNYARVATEIINSRRVIDEVCKRSGLLSPEQTPFEQEVIKENLRKATTVSSVSSNLIKIEYKDVSPERAAKVTNGLAEMFVQESSEAKDRESRAAFEFIDKQVKQYHDKLVDAEQKLKEIRSKNLDAQPGSESAIQTRINDLQSRFERTKLELEEAKIRHKSIQHQLEGESAMSASLNREGQYHDRIMQLQRDLDSMRLQYKDTHPDIVRTLHKIEDLKEAIAKEEERRKLAKQMGTQPVGDPGVTVNPLYQQLRSELSSTQTQIATLRTRLAETEALLKKEMDRGVRLHQSEAALAEFTRDYEVNRDIYHQLLTRRERARVSMNLDTEGGGFTFRIHEKATIPVRPTGLRLLHFMIGGIVLGILVPVLVIYAMIQIDPRLRIPSIISSKLNIPVLVEVPHLPTVKEVSRAKLRFRFLLMLVSTVLFVYAYVGWLKWTGSI